MISSRLRKVFGWSLGITLGLLAMIAIAAAIAVRMIDTPKIRAQLTAQLSQAVNGEMTWQNLEVRLLPSPRVSVQGVHFAMPNLVTVDAAAADVTLRLMPLFHGSAQTKAIILRKPHVDVWIAKSADEEPPSPARTPLALYQAALRPTLDIVARFAPDTALEIDDGRVALHIEQLPTFEATEIDLRIVTDGKQIHIDTTAAGSFWAKVQLEGNVAFDDLSAAAKVAVSGLRPQPILDQVLPGIREALVLSDVSANLEASTDGHTGIYVGLQLELPKAEVLRRGRQIDIIQVELAGSVKLMGEDILVSLHKARLGEMAPSARASLQLSGASHAPRLEVTIDALDLARLREAALLLAGDQPIVSEYIGRIASGRLRDLRCAAQAESFADLFSLDRLRASVNVENAGMRIPFIERDAQDIAAQAELSEGVLKISGIDARIGASRVSQGSAAIVLHAPMRLERVRAQASLAVHDLLPGLREREALAEALKAVPAISGTINASLNNFALRFDKPSQLVFDLTARPRQLRVEDRQLPAPLIVNGGTVRITRQSIDAQRIGVATLDGSATLSVSVADLQGKQPRVTASVVDGFADAKLMEWIWQRASLPERLLPATPIRFAAKHLQWNGGNLDLAAGMNFPSGLAVDIDFAMVDKIVSLRSGTIKDRDSNATLSFGIRGPLVDASFAGTLATRSLAAALAHPKNTYHGRVAGEVQLTFDRELQRRTTARGTLHGEQIDLENLIALPIKIERFDIQGKGDALQIDELSVDWADQKATLRGEIARPPSTGSERLTLKLDVDTPGVIIDALRSKPTSSAAAGGATKSQSEETTQRKDAPFDPWSLPISGTVNVHAGFLEYEGRRVEGIRAAVALEKKQATLALTEASLCGISVPLSLRVDPKTFDAKLNLTAKDRTLDNLAHCLGSKEVSVTGNFDVSAVLGSKGSLDDIGRSLVENLSGTIAFNARQGQIRKLALLGNILALKSVAEVVKGDVKLGGEGFGYNGINVIGHITEGKIEVEQAALDSAALGLAAAGSIDLRDFDSRLTVLVAPFGTLDRIVRNIPVLGYIIGGAITSIPVGVSGDIRSPLVVPLGPGAIGSEVLGIFERTFKLPGKIVEPLTSGSEK